ncbi:MAG: FG-GAP repeat protein [Bacteroidota bacterium]
MISICFDSNGAWTFVKEINPNQGDKRMMDFGRSVSLDGGFLVVGAPDGNSSLGQVFVFHKDRGGANNWGQIDIINKPSHNGGNDFGQSLKLNGDELAVSAQRTDTAFVYQLLNAGTPASQLIHEVKPANPVSSIQVFVVSYEQDVLTMSRRGLVTEGEIFTFKINSTSPQDWNETTRIAPPPGVTPNRFRPTDPKVSGDLLAFCALDDQVQGTSTNQRISKVFIYERDALGGWMLSQEIKSPQDEFQSKFGQTLAWDGTDLYIGAPFADGSFASSGAIHIYKPDASGLYQLYDTFFDCDAMRSDQFGSDIEIDDGHLLIAPRVDLSVQSVEIQKIKSDCIAIEDISSQDVTGSQQSTFRAGMRLNSDARLFHVAPVRFTAGTEVVFQPAFEIGFCGQLQVDIADCD